MIHLSDLKLAKSIALDEFQIERLSIRDNLILRFGALVGEGERTLDGLLSKLSSDEQYVVRCFLPDFVSYLSDEVESAKKLGRVPDMEALERAFQAVEENEINYVKRPFFDDIDEGLVFDLARSGSLYSEKSKEIFALDNARQAGLIPLLMYIFKKRFSKK